MVASLGGPPAVRSAGEGALPPPSPPSSIRPVDQPAVVGRGAARAAERGARSLLAGRTAEARERFLAAQVLAPEQPELHYDLGLAALVEGDWETARRSFELAAQAAPSAVGPGDGTGEPRLALDATYNQAHVSLRVGELDRALGELARVVEQDPASADARRNLEIALRLRQAVSAEPRGGGGGAGQGERPAADGPRPQQAAPEDSRPVRGPAAEDEGRDERREPDPRGTGGSLTRARAEEILDALAEEERRAVRERRERRGPTRPAPGSKPW